MKTVRSGKFAGSYPRRAEAVLVGALLLAGSSLTGCTTGLTGSDPFGLASATSGPAALAVAEGAAPAGQDAGAPAEMAAADAGGLPGVAAEAAAPASGASAPTDVRSGTISAAYAGASVDGDGASGSGGRSLFESLFSQAEARTPLPNAARGRERRVIVDRDGSGENTLPGVDANSLFEIGQLNSADEEIYEDAVASYQVASLSGFARLAPNGLKVQRDSVETGCFPQKLLGILNAVERRFGTKVIVTSGYRSPAHNKRVNGATHSQHMQCTAADILIPGADRMEVARFVRAMPGRGGVGTYCHTQSIHVDVGGKRDWNWRCRRGG